MDWLVLRNMNLVAPLKCTPCTCAASNNMQSMKSCKSQWNADNNATGLLHMYSLRRELILLFVSWNKKNEQPYLRLEPWGPWDYHYHVVFMLYNLTKLFSHWLSHFHTDSQDSSWIYAIPIHSPPPLFPIHKHTHTSRSLVGVYSNERWNKSYAGCFRDLFSDSFMLSGAVLDWHWPIKHQNMDFFCMFI